MSLAENLKQLIYDSVYKNVLTERTQCDII